MLARLTLLCAFIAVNLGFSAPLFGQSGTFNVNLGLFDFSYDNTHYNNGLRADTSSRFTFITLGGCFFLTNQICIGAKTLMGTKAETVKVQNANGTTNSGKSTRDWSGTGLSLGYMNDGWSALFTYLLNGKRIDKDGGGNVGREYTAGTAYQLDLGYGFAVRSVRIGPMISLSHFDYDKVKTGGEEVKINGYKDQFLVPYLALWFGF